MYSYIKVDKKYVLGCTSMQTSMKIVFWLLVICYLVKVSRWVGALKTTSLSFQDNDPIFMEENDKYVIIRLVSWKASHDIGQKGFSLGYLRRLIALIENEGQPTDEKVLLTFEAIK